MTTDVTISELVAEPALARHSNVASFFARWASQIGITFAFVAVWATFVILAPRRSFTPGSTCRSPRRCRTSGWWR